MLNKNVLSRMGRAYYSGVKTTSFECVKCSTLFLRLTLVRGECGTITATLVDCVNAVENTYLFRNMSDFKNHI